MTEIRKLKIKTLSQELYELEVAQDIPITELKQILHQKTQVPVDRQRLIYLGKQIPDTVKLSDLIKEDGQTIHLMAMTQSQQPHPPQQQQQPQFQNLGSSNFNIQINQGDPNNMMFPLGNINNLVQNLISQIPNRNPQQNNPQQNPQQNVQPNAQQSNQQGPQIRTNLFGQFPPQPQRAASGPRPQQQQNAHDHTNMTEISFSQNERRGQLVQLPLQQIQTLSRSLDSLIHPDGIFPGPPLPVVQTNRNNITILGNLLHQVSFSLQRSIPVIQRTADLLVREPFQTVTDERRQTEYMIRSTADTLRQIHTLSNIYELLQHVDSRTLARTISCLFAKLITPKSQKSTQQQTQQNTQTTSQTNPQQQTQQPIQQQPVQHQQPIQNPQLQQSPQQQSDSDDIQIEEVQVIVGGFDSNGQISEIPQNIQNIINQFGQNIQFGGFQQYPPQAVPQQASQQAPQQAPQPVPQQASQPQQNAQQLGQPQQAGQQQQFNPANLLGNLLGGGGEGGVSFATMSIRDLMIQNYANQMEEGEKELMDIFGDVKVGDLMGYMMNGNLRFLDPLQQSIKEKLKVKIEEAGGRIELVDKIAHQFLSTFVPKNQQILLEGIDANVIASEILVKHVKLFFQIIDKDFTNSVERFGDACYSQFYKMVGEVVFELSEACNNGLDDYKQALQQNLSELMNKSVGPEMGAMFGLLVFDKLWNFAFKAYNSYQESLNQQQEQQQNKQDEAVTEEQLINLIKEAEKTLEVKPVEFSENYLKGDPTYQKFE
ncbi:hypothetical protein pb186bvf_019922 [Paramecium bursaria]